jgi:hypothetical protein
VSRPGKAEPDGRDPPDGLEALGDPEAPECERAGRFDSDDRLDPEP